MGVLECRPMHLGLCSELVHDLFGYICDFLQGFLRGLLNHFYRVVVEVYLRYVEKTPNLCTRGSV